MDKNVSGFVKHFLRETHNMSVITESLEGDRSREPQTQSPGLPSWSAINFQ